MLAREWRKITRAATFVAVLTSPVMFSLLYVSDGWPLGWAVIVTFLAVITFRGMVDLLIHRLIPRPGLFGADKAMLEEDALGRRRVWYWRKKLRHTLWFGGTLFGLLLIINVIQNATGSPHSLGQTLSGLGGAFGGGQSGGGGTLLVLLLQLPLLFLINFGILFGPMLMMGLRQMKGYEPGDADWGVAWTMCAGRPSPRRTSRASSRCGSRARSSARPAASPSADCCSSARRAPARRCSPRRSPRASTRRS